MYSQPLIKAAIYIRKTRNFLKLCFCRRKLLDVAGPIKKVAPNAKSCQVVQPVPPRGSVGPGAKYRFVGPDDVIMSGSGWRAS